MNKAMIFPIHKKWVDMIFDGSKDLEFRNKLPKDLKSGMKIYFYEALGDRKLIHLWKSYPLYIQHRWSKNENTDELSNYVTEGTGMIVGEATVGEIYELEYDKKYDEVLFKQNGVVMWSNSFSSRNIEGYTNQKYAIEVTNVIEYDEPIPKEEFISWNKVDNLIKNNFEKSEIKTSYKAIFNEIIDGLLTYGDKQCNVSAPPQAPMYVVEIPYDTE